MVRVATRASIALLHYAAPPVVGGVESILAEHARLMSNAGHDVRVLAGRGDQAALPVPFVSLPLLDSLDDRIQALKRELDSGGMPVSLEHVTAEIEVQLAKELEDVDLVFAHNVCSLHKNLALTAALRRLFGARRLRRLILWHHDLAWATPRYLPELHDGYPWDLLRTDWGAEHVVVSAVRKGELSSLMGLANERIRVVPNGIDPVAWLKLEPESQGVLTRLHLDAADPLILLPVRVTPRKNVEMALQVLAEVRKVMPRATLVITGPPGPHNPANREYLADLLALRSELGVGAGAHFLTETEAAPVSDAVVSDLYRVADLLFLPSKEEGFGLPLLEAAFQRLPVFCADIPVLRELGGEDVAYFGLQDDPASVAASLVAFLRANPTHRFRSRAWAKHTWDAVYRNHIAPLIES